MWFQDEARVGQQGTLTRVWTRLGTRPRALRDTRYEWASPVHSNQWRSPAHYSARPARTRRGRRPRASACQHRGDEPASRRDRFGYSTGRARCSVLDGAGWHGGKDLVVPNNITLITLPPYSPELNPVENVWQYLRANKLANTVFDSYDKILDQCAAAWNFFANDPAAITSITSRDWATVNV